MSSLPKRLPWPSKKRGTCSLKVWCKLKRAFHLHLPPKWHSLLKVISSFSLIITIIPYIRWFSNFSQTHLRIWKVFVSYLICRCINFSWMGSCENITTFTKGCQIIYKRTCITECNWIATPSMTPRVAVKLYNTQLSGVFIHSKLYLFLSFFNLLNANEIGCDLQSLI